MIYLKTPLFFPLAFGLVDVLILLPVADSWFYKSSVDVSPRGLTVTGGLFGLGKARWVDASDIAKIEPDQGSIQTGGTVYYNIIITCRTGKNIKAAKRLAPHHLAKAIADQITQAMVKH